MGWRGLWVGRMMRGRRAFARGPSIFLTPASSRPARVAPRRAGCHPAGVGPVVIRRAAGAGVGVCGSGPPDGASGWGAGVAWRAHDARARLPAGLASFWPQHHPGPCGLPRGGPVGIRRA